LPRIGLRERKDSPANLVFSKSAPEGLVKITFLLEATTPAEETDRFDLSLITIYHNFLNLLLFTLFDDAPID